MTSESLADEVARPVRAADDPTPWNYGTDFFAIGPAYSNGISPHLALCEGPGTLVFRIKGCGWSYQETAIVFTECNGQPFSGWPTGVFGLPLKEPGGVLTMANLCPSPGATYKFNVKLNNGIEEVVIADPSIENVPSSVGGD
jgi:hypothetical protein